MSALARHNWRDLRPDTGRVIEVGFRLLGWFAVSLLAAAGLFVVVFVAFGNFTLEGFFLQLANLSNRYGSANAGRRVAFGNELQLVGAIALAATMICRRASFSQVFAARGKD
jgi:hypothetical protein